MYRRSASPWGHRLPSVAASAGIEDALSLHEMKLPPSVGFDVLGVGSVSDARVPMLDLCSRLRAPRARSKTFLFSSSLLEDQCLDLVGRGLRNTVWMHGKASAVYVVAEWVTQRVGAVQRLQVEKARLMSALASGARTRSEGSRAWQLTLYEKRINIGTWLSRPV